MVPRTPAGRRSVAHGLVPVLGRQVVGPLVGVRPTVRAVVPGPVEAAGVRPVPSARGSIGTRIPSGEKVHGDSYPTRVVGTKVQ